MDEYTEPVPTAAEIASVAQRLRVARETERAPAAVRVRIEAQHALRNERARPRRAAWPVSVIAGAAAVIAVVVALSSGSAGSPTISGAAALAARGPSGPAPALVAGRPGELSAHVGSLHFPSLAGAGLRAAGERRDRLDGRLVLTVYYAGSGGTIAYSILATPALPNTPAGGRYSVATIGGRTVVAWANAGHTCVISSAGVLATSLPSLI